MTRSLASYSSVGGELDHLVTSPEDWKWPVAPTLMKVFDKYSQTEAILRLDEHTWTFGNAGDVATVRFSSGKAGSLQRRLALITQRGNSPSVLRRFSAVLVAEWEALLRILATSPEQVRAAWAVEVSNTRVSGTFKVVLKLACTAGVGHWRPAHLPLVSSLDTLMNPSTKKRLKAIASREKVASIELQAEVVRVLDAAVKEDELSEAEVEGAVALAISYQHGMRPVQMLCLDVSHARFFRDASNDLACVLSFHAAKQSQGKEFEVLRQVRPEWVPLLARLHAQAIASGRNRLFRETHPTDLWLRAKAVCKRYGVSLTCTATMLRHTAAQTLADAGHSRSSIQAFLGHVNDQAARHYIRASFNQAELINTALGASKLYTSLLAISQGSFVSEEALREAEEDQQVGAVVGERLVAGVGLCKTGQDNCAYNPVTSCYGCPKFMPSLDRGAHMEAIAGMREQVRIYLQQGVTEETPAYRQLTRALSGAQQALAAIDHLQESSL
jgi:integrase